MTPAFDRPSPNHGPRRDGLIPSLIVLHYTAMETAEAAIERLCDPTAEVSAHYVIDEAGSICQLVDERRRAWHAGAGRWGDVSDINSASIGVELANDGATPFSDAQMAALSKLLHDVRARWSIPAKNVIGHSDMAPGRKGDPGAFFDWRWLAVKGHAVWPEPDRAALETSEYWSDLTRFGYPVELGRAAVHEAFRLRFRPGETGPPDAVDHAMAADLARRFPVDPPRREA